MRIWMDDAVYTKRITDHRIDNIRAKNSIRMFPTNFELIIMFLPTKKLGLCLLNFFNLLTVAFSSKRCADVLHHGIEHISTGLDV